MESVMIKLFIWTVGETLMAQKMVVKFQIWKTKNTRNTRDNLPSPNPTSPVNWTLKDITEKQLQVAKLLWPRTTSLSTGQIDFSLVTVNP